MDKQNVKIGLALGGGGAKGFAHIGVLKVFDKHRIKISSIVGASAGAAVGAGYALGLSPDEILKYSESMYSKKLLRIRNFRLFGESLIKTNDMDNAIYRIVGDKTFQDLKIPFTAIAVDLEDGKEILIKEGKLWNAVRASAALPGIFSPIFTNGRYLVDGGLLNNLPADHLREQQDLDLIIGIDLGKLISPQYISGMIWERYYKKPKFFDRTEKYFSKLKNNSVLMFNIMLRSIDIVSQEVQSMRLQKANPELVIRPDVEEIAILEFNKYKEAVLAGEKAAEAAMPQILELIQKKSAKP